MRSGADVDRHRESVGRWLAVSYPGVPVPLLPHQVRGIVQRAGIQEVARMTNPTTASGPPKPAHNGHQRGRPSGPWSVTFVDHLPPPELGRPSRYAPVLQAVQKDPGHWARVDGLQRGGADVLRRKGCAIARRGDRHAGTETFFVRWPADAHLLTTTLSNGAHS